MQILSQAERQRCDGAARRLKDLQGPRVSPRGKMVQPNSYVCIVKASAEESGLVSTQQIALEGYKMRICGSLLPVSGLSGARKSSLKVKVIGFG